MPTATPRPEAGGGKDSNRAKKPMAGKKKKKKKKAEVPGAEGGEVPQGDPDSVEVIIEEASTSAIDEDALLPSIRAGADPAERLAAAETPAGEAPAPAAADSQVDALPARAKSLLGKIVRPGEHALEFYARWASEVERGEMSHAAARYWAKNGRNELLHPCQSLADSLEEWDEEEHGRLPEEGSPEWEGADDLMGECDFVYQDVAMRFPEEGFFAERMTSEEEQYLELSDLYQTACVDFELVTESKMYPGLLPSTWECSTGWKGNFGTTTLVVEMAVSLRELLLSNRLTAKVWMERGGMHVQGLTVGDGEVEWENSNSKSMEFEVKPPDDIRTWRIAGNAIGRIMGLYRRASERVYMPVRGKPSQSPPSPCLPLSLPRSLSVRRLAPSIFLAGRGWDGSHASRIRRAPTCARGARRRPASHLRQDGAWRHSDLWPAHKRAHAAVERLAA